MVEAPPGHASPTGGHDGDGVHRGAPRVGRSHYGPRVAAGEDEATAVSGAANLWISARLSDRRSPIAQTTSTTTVVATARLTASVTGE